MMITFTAMLVGLVIFAMVYNAYCLWIRIVERRMWKNMVDRKALKLENCMKELEEVKGRRNEFTAGWRRRG